MYQIRKKTREKRDEIESITQETLSISGITLIKSFAREAYERSRFYRSRDALMQLEIDLAMVGRWFIASVTAMVVVGPALVWFGGGWLAITAGLQVGVIVAFVSFIQGRLYGPAAALAGIQVQIVSALAVFERIFDYLDMTPGRVRSARSDRAARRHRRHRVRERRLRVRRIARRAQRRLLPRAARRSRRVRRAVGRG